MILPPEISVALITAGVVAIGVLITWLQLRKTKMELEKGRLRAKESAIELFDRATIEAKARELDNRQQNEKMIRDLLASQLEQNRLISERLDKTTVDLDTVKNKLQIAEKERAEASEKAVLLQAKVENLTADLTRAAEASQRRDQQIGELRGTLDAQKVATDADRERMEKQIADLTDANKIISRAKGDTKRELERATKERDDALARAEQLEKHAQELELQMTALRADVEALRAKVDELTRPQAIAIAINAEEKQIAS